MSADLMDLLRYRISGLPVPLYKNFLLKEEIKESVEEIYSIPKARKKLNEAERRVWNKVRPGARSNEKERENLMKSGKRIETEVDNYPLLNQGPSLEDLYKKRMEENKVPTVISLEATKNRDELYIQFFNFIKDKYKINTFSEISEMGKKPVIAGLIFETPTGKIYIVKYDTLSIGQRQAMLSSIPNKDREGKYYLYLEPEVDSFDEDEDEEITLAFTKKNFASEYRNFLDGKFKLAFPEIIDNTDGNIKKVIDEELASTDKRSMVDASVVPEKLPEEQEEQPEFLEDPPIAILGINKSTSGETIVYNVKYRTKSNKTDNIDISFPYTSIELISDEKTDDIFNKYVKPSYQYVSNKLYVTIHAIHYIYMGSSTSPSFTTYNNILQGLNKKEDFFSDAYSLLVFPCKMLFGDGSYGPVTDNVNIFAKYTADALVIIENFIKTHKPNYKSNVNNKIIETQPSTSGSSSIPKEEESFATGSSARPLKEEEELPEPMKIVHGFISSGVLPKGDSLRDKIDALRKNIDESIMILSQPENSNLKDNIFIHILEPDDIPARLKFIVNNFDKITDHRSIGAMKKQYKRKDIILEEFLVEYINTGLSSETDKQKQFKSFSDCYKTPTRSLSRQFYTQFLLALTRKEEANITELFNAFKTKYEIPLNVTANNGTLKMFNLDRLDLSQLSDDRTSIEQDTEKNIQNNENEFANTVSQIPTQETVNKPSSSAAQK